MADTDDITTMEQPLDEAGAAEVAHVYTEAEIKEVAEALNTGVFPVAHHNIDELIVLVNTLTATIDKVFSDKKFGKDDFLALQSLWDQSWVVAGLIAAIEEEAKKLGLLSKISLAVKGFGALSKLMKAIKKAKQP